MSHRVWSKTLLLAVAVAASDHGRPLWAAEPTSAAERPPSWCGGDAPVAAPARVRGVALDRTYAPLFGVGNRFAFLVEHVVSGEEGDRKEQWTEDCVVSHTALVGDQLQATWSCTDSREQGAKQRRWAATAEGLLEPDLATNGPATNIVAVPRPPKAGKGHERGDGWEESWQRRMVKLEGPRGARVTAWSYQRDWGNGAGMGVRLWLVAHSGVVRWATHFGDSDSERQRLEASLKSCGGPAGVAPAPPR